MFLRALKTIQEHKELRNSYKGSTNDLVLKFIPGMFLNRLEKIVVLLVSQLPQPETFKAQRLGVQNKYICEGFVVLLYKDLDNVPNAPCKQTQHC